MINWVVSPFLVVAGSLAGWLVAKDAPNFALVQSVIAIMLIVLVVYALAFWPSGLTWTRLFHRFKSFR